MPKITEWSNVSYSDKKKDEELYLVELIATDKSLHLTGSSISLIQLSFLTDNMPSDPDQSVWL